MKRQHALPETAAFTADIQNFVAVLKTAQIAGYLARHHDCAAFNELSLDHQAILLRACNVHSHVGKTWVRIDVGESGRYMVNAEGCIFGIKAYGVPNLIRYYGALNTLNCWDWSEHYATMKPLFVQQAQVDAFVAEHPTAAEFEKNCLDSIAGAPYATQDESGAAPKGVTN